MTSKLIEGRIQVKQSEVDWYLGRAMLLCCFQKEQSAALVGPCGGSSRADS